MRKVWIIVLIAVLLLSIGIITGIYVYQRNQTQDSNIRENNQLAIQNEQLNDELQNNIVSTSTLEEKISPNCVLIEKQYFKGCDHLVREINNIPEELINCSKELVEQIYLEWEIEDFTSNQVMLYQEQEGYCNRHYIVREHNGVLGIFVLDEQGNETLKEDTDIQTMYLPEEDLERVKNGIEALGDMELHTVLEDFE